MSSTGPNYGSTTSQSGANISWTNLSNALVEDGAVASCVGVGPGGGGGFPNQLIVKGMGFNLPPTAIIDGIKLEAKVQTTGGATAIDNFNGNTQGVCLNFNGGATSVANTPNSGQFWPSSGLTWLSWGGAASLWGKTWTYADINNANFGAQLAAMPGTGTATINVDSTRITVYWHTAPTTVFKEYYYKSFNPSGTFLGNLPTPSSDLAFSQDVNNAGSQTTIVIPKSADTSNLAVDNLTDEAGNLLTDESLNQLTDEGQMPIYLPSSYTEDALIKNGNLIQIWVVNYWHPNGKCVFLGIMENCAATFGGDAQDDSITIVAYGDGEDLDNYMLRASPYTYTQDQAQGASNTFFTLDQIRAAYDKAGQTWTVGAGVTNLGAISVAFFGSANVTIDVYDSPSLTNHLGTSTQYVSAPNEITVQFAFANAIVTTPGQTLFFTLSVDDGQSIQVPYQNSNVYANGSMYTASYGGGGGGGGYSATANDLYFITYSATGSTTATISNTDPTVMLEDFMNDYIARGGVISYNSSTVQATGLSLTASFNTDTILGGIQEVLTMAPSGFYFYIDLGTDLLYFQQASTTADVTLTKGLHMNTIKIAESIEYLVNLIYFTGGPNPSNPPYNVYTSDSDTASIAKYRPRLDRPTNSNVIDGATAHSISQEEIATHKKPSNLSVVTVLDKAIDIYSLHVGQVVGFNGFGNFADSLLAQITRIDWQAEQATLTLGILPKRIATTVEQNVKALVALNTVSTNTNPSSPS